MITIIVLIISGINYLATRALTTGEAK
jgi:hypothetical protein